MTKTIRISTPGNDALTTTDPDKFALYADSDWVLIKEFARGSGSVDYGRVATIDHDLGYIPTYMIWTEIDTNNTYRLNNAQNVVGSGGWKTWASTSSINIENNYSSDYTNYRYYIFYDRMSDSGSTTFTESDYAVKISQSGADALTTTDPNDYIFHSDLNTFKILAEGSFTNQYVDANPKVFTLTHNKDSPPAVYGFADFGNGFIAQAGSKARHDSAPPIEYYWKIEVDDDDVRFLFYQPTVPQINYYVDFKYYIFETPAT